MVGPAADGGAFVYAAYTICDSGIIDNSRIESIDNEEMDFTFKIII
jgi:hypothetical protein